MASSSETYCLCGQPYNVGQFMIECDCCREWFHGSCVNVKVYQSEDIDKYHCPKCATTYGPSIFKVITNEHRQDRYEMHAERRAVQTGSRTFVSAMATRTFPRDRHVVHLHGKDFTEAYLKDTGFNKPLMFESVTGLELRVPVAATFSAHSVARHVGASREVDVIDVARQANFKMQLGDFVDYFTGHERAKVLNVLSLEFSDTPMSSMVTPPLMARQLDWVRVVWPSTSAPLSPLVQKYCIMSAAGSYTDFHVDFGGTTVWYHVLHGQKVFYLIPPTAANLALYQQWSSSPNQNEVFFGDLVESCSSCSISSGQTLFIPTGWIHAVLTPEDSLVFGGNFLHSLNIELQLQVNEIEKQIETPQMFRFPSFETIHWYAGSYLLQQLRRINEEQADRDFTLGEGQPPPARLDLPSYLVRGVRILAAALKEWHSCKAYDQVKKDNIPDTINSGQLVRELARELRRLEKLLAPPPLLTPCKKRKRPRTQEVKTKAAAPPTVGHFAAISASRRPLKLTTPAPIVHAAGLPLQHTDMLVPGSRGDDVHCVPYVPALGGETESEGGGHEDAELQSVASLAGRRGLASYTGDSQDSFGDGDTYRAPEPPPPPHSRPVLKIKLGSTLSSTLQTAYEEPSLLKAQLSQPRPSAWTISTGTGSTLLTNEQNANYRHDFKDQSLPPYPGKDHYYSGSDTGVDYGPEFVQRKEGPVDYGPELGANSLPDYSPTKSMQEYMGGERASGNFANNSDPYAALRERAVPSPLSDDCTVLTGTDGYRLIQDDNKTQARLAAAYEYEYVDEVPPPPSKIKTNNGKHSFKVSPGAIEHVAQNVLLYDNGTPVKESHSPHTPALAPPPSYGASIASRRTERPHRKRVDPRSSIYDYEELDEGALLIDETGRPPHHRRRRPRPKPGPAQAYRSGAEDGRAAGFAAPKNGIESLLQASAYTGSSDTQERDAVAGMLSIGQSYGLARDDTPNAPAEAPPIRAVHRDDEYVYPSLEMSTDEEEDAPRRHAPRSAQRRRPSHNTPHEREDESWSPRGRLGRLLPRLNRPSRKGSRKEAVQAALRAARLRGTPPIPQVAPPLPVNMTPLSSAPPPRVLPHPTPLREPQALVSLKKPYRKKRPLKQLRPAPPPHVLSPTVPKAAKFKKGMKTAKQRLGKILKIHKMIC